MFFFHEKISIFWNIFSSNGSTVGPYANETMPAHPFAHPWFQAWIMFIGEFLVLFVYACYRRNLQKQLWEDYIIQVNIGFTEAYLYRIYTSKSRSTSHFIRLLIQCLIADPLMTSGHLIVFLVLWWRFCDNVKPETVAWLLYLARYQIKSSTSYPPEPPAMPGYIAPIFFITGFFDILGSSLAAIGLVYIDASVWMMFRGSMIIFAGRFCLLKGQSVFLLVLMVLLIDFISFNLILSLWIVYPDFFLQVSCLACSSRRKWA